MFHDPFIQLCCYTLIMSFPIPHTNFKSNHHVNIELLPHFPLLTFISQDLLLSHHTSIRYCQHSIHTHTHTFQLHLMFNQYTPNETPRKERILLTQSTANTIHVHSTADGTGDYYRSQYSHSDRNGNYFRHSLKPPLYV